MAVITTRVRKSGQVRYQVYCGRDAPGEQRFKTFKERKDAETFLGKLGIAKANESQQLWSALPGQRAEAIRCLKIFLPYADATLTVTVARYVDTDCKYQNAPTIAVIIEQLICGTKN